MRSRAGLVLVILAGLALGACRQADGQMPTPDDNIREELGDVTRDLLSIASGRDPQAQSDLSSDLGKYTEKAVAQQAVAELSRQIAGVLAGSQLSEQSAQRLAHSLWVTVAALDLSERQIENLQNDLRLLLVSIGVAEASAQQIATQAGAIQVEVTEHPRRWYELF